MGLVHRIGLDIGLENILEDSGEFAENPALSSESSERQCTLESRKEL